MFGMISYEYVIFGAIDLHQEQQVLPHTQNQVLIELFNLSYAIYIFWCYLIKYKMELDQVHVEMFSVISSTCPNLSYIFAQDTITSSNSLNIQA